jgi:hypothetical protein
MEVKVREISDLLGGNRSGVDNGQYTKLSARKYTMRIFPLSQECMEMRKKRAQTLTKEINCVPNIKEGKR